MAFKGPFQLKEFYDSLLCSWIPLEMQTEQVMGGISLLGNHTPACSITNGPIGVSSLCVPNPQEFLTLNSEKPPFVRDVEEKVRRYLRSSYSAAWTLKITWEKAPAYGARGDSRRVWAYESGMSNCQNVPFLRKPL